MTERPWKLIIGDLEFVEDHCIIEASGQTSCVFVSETGGKRVEICLPSSAWRKGEKKGELVLASGPEASKRVAALLASA